MASHPLLPHPEKLLTGGEVWRIPRSDAPRQVPWLYPQQDLIEADRRRLHQDPSTSRVL